MNGAVVGVTAGAEIDSERVALRGWELHGALVDCAVGTGRDSVFSYVDNKYVWSTIPADQSHCDAVALGYGYCRTWISPIPTVKICPSQLD